MYEAGSDLTPALHRPRRDRPRHAWHAARDLRYRLPRRRVRRLRRPCPRDLKTILDDLGLRTSGVHVPLDSWETNPEKVLAEMETLDCAHAVLPSAPPERRSDEASVARLA